MSTTSDSVTRASGSSRYDGGWTYASDDDLFSKPNMDRFEKSFHGIDRTTSRPFSHGHPDGVWVLAIIYGLFIVTAGVFVAAQIWQAPHGQVGVGMTIPFFVAVAVFVPPIVLLFQRKSAAVIWISVLALISIGGDVMAISSLLKAHALQVPTIVGLVMALLLQVYPAFYAFGLKKDSLLS